MSRSAQHWLFPVFIVRLLPFVPDVNLLLSVNVVLSSYLANISLTTLKFNPAFHKTCMDTVPRAKGRFRAVANTFMTNVYVSMENLALQRLTLQIKFVPTDVNHIEVFM